jgi:hypothetical protein
MQHDITPAEAHALCGRALEVLGRLERALTRYVCPPVRVATPPPPSEVRATPVALPMKPIAPVLTLRLSDILREQEIDRQEELARQARRRPPVQVRYPKRRIQIREAEVTYRKSFRLVS